MSFKEAMTVVRRGVTEAGWRGKQVKDEIRQVVAEPDGHLDDPLRGELARALVPILRN